MLIYYDPETGEYSKTIIPRSIRLKLPSRTKKHAIELILSTWSLGCRKCRSYDFGRNENEFIAVWDI